MLDENSAPITQVLVNGYQIPDFYGPDGILSMYAQPSQAGSARFKMSARDTAALAAALATVSSLSFSVAAPTGVAATDTANIQAKIAAAASAGGGRVTLAAGNYVTNATLTAPLSSGTSSLIKLVGAGKGATTITRNGNFILLDISGTNTSTWLYRFGVEDLTLVGGGNPAWTAAVVRTWYAQQLSFQRVHWNNSYGNALDALQLYDTWFYDCEIDYCGNTGGTGWPIWIKCGQQGTTTGQFGFGADNSNNIWMINTRIEQCRGGGIYLDGRNESGTYTGSRQINRCYFINLKQENTQTTFSHPFFKAENCNHIVWEHGHASGKSLDPGASGALNFIELTSVNIGAFRTVNLNTLAGAAANSGRAGIALLGNNNLIDLNQISGNTQSDNKFTVALVEFTGTNTLIREGIIDFQFNGGSSRAIEGAPTSRSNSRSGGDTPAINNLKAWAFDVAMLGGSTQVVTAGQLVLVKIPVQQTDLFTNVVVQTSAAGSGLTGAYGALFNSSGTRLGLSSDQTTAVSTGTGTRSFPLTVDSGQSLTVQGREGVFVYAALLFVGTTPPVLHRLGNINPNANLAAADGLRFALGATGLSVVPTSVTVSGFTSGAPIWVGLK